MLIEMINFILEMEQVGNAVDSQFNYCGLLWKLKSNAMDWIAVTFLKWFYVSSK